MQPTTPGIQFCCLKVATERAPFLWLSLITMRLSASQHFRNGLSCIIKDSKIEPVPFLFSYVIQCKRDANLLKNGMCGGKTPCNWRE